MNEVLKTIHERRSIRSFTDEPIDKEMIREIIDAGLCAPSGKNMQDVIILVAEKEETKRKFRKANRKIGNYPEDFDPFYGAAVYLIVLSQKGWCNSKYDGACAMENMMLAAHSLGLGSVWINRAYEEFEIKEFQDLLKEHHIEGLWEGVGHCAIGHIKGELPKAKAIKEGRVFYLDE